MKHAPNDGSLVLFLGFVVILSGLLAISYPGSMTNDTVSWIHQARTGVYHDVQPIGAPLMFALTEKFMPGPMGFVICNLVIVSASLLLVFRKAIGGLIAPLVATMFVLVNPAVLTILPMAWRDITGAGITLATLLLTIITIQRLETRDEHSFRFFFLTLILMIALTTAGTLFRANHIAGALPLIAVPLYILFRQRWQVVTSFSLAAVCTIIAISIAYSLASKVSGTVVDNNLFGRQASVNYQLAQISVHENVNLMPAILYPDLDLETLREMLDSKRSYIPFWHAFALENRPELPRLTTDTQFRTLQKALTAAILRYPGTYVRIRIRDIGRKLTRTYRSLPAHQIPPKAKGMIEMNFPYSRPAWSTYFLSYADAINKLFPAKTPIPLLLTSIVLTVIALVFRFPSAVLMVVISSSAALHIALVLWFAMVYEHRYGHQSTMFLLVATFLFSFDLFNAACRRRQIGSKTLISRRTDAG